MSAFHQTEYSWNLATIKIQTYLFYLGCFQQSFSHTAMESGCGWELNAYFLSVFLTEISHPETRHYKYFS